MHPHSLIESVDIFSKFQQLSTVDESLGKFLVYSNSDIRDLTAISKDNNVFQEAVNKMLLELVKSIVLKIVVPIISVIAFIIT